MSTWFKAAVAGAITLATGLLGGWDLAVQGLLFFLAADYILAMLRAVGAGAFNSSAGVRGLFRKLAQLAAVAIAHGLDIYVFRGTPWARTLTVVVLTLNEAGSTLAHLAAMGVPLPAPVKQALEGEILRKQVANTVTDKRGGAA